MLLFRGNSVRNLVISVHILTYSHVPSSRCYGEVTCSFGMMRELDVAETDKRVITTDDE